VCKHSCPERLFVIDMDRGVGKRVSGRSFDTLFLRFRFPFVYNYTNMRYNPDFLVGSWFNRDSTHDNESCSSGIVSDDNHVIPFILGIGPFSPP
jgi:hypothetical protein